MMASRRTKEDFCALRLTCKDVYLKTFRLFGRYYFTTVSVGFTRVSLDRLRTLASYKNTFGLTLFEFPSHLIVSTLRLLPENEVDRLFSMSDPQEDAQAVVAAITMLSELGIESYNVPGEYNPDTYAIAGNYRKAVASQQSLTTSSCDINKIARAIATFPKFCSIALDTYEKSWGEEDWQNIAGFDRRVFVSSGDINSGQNNLEFTLNRILQAIAQAQTICHANGRTLNFFSLTTGAFDGSGDCCPYSHQNVRLQSLDIQPFSRKALKAAFSRLKFLSIDIYDFVTLDEHKDSPKRINEALQVLLSSPGLSELSISFIDSAEIVNDDLSNMSQSDNTWIGDQILSTIAEVGQSNSLERLELFCLAIVKSKDAVEEIVKKSATTLKALSLEILIPDPGVMPPNISVERSQYKPLLRILAGCPLLEQLVFHIEPVADECPVAEFDMIGKELITRRVQNMIMNHTDPDNDAFWADVIETEEDSGDED